MKRKNYLWAAVILAMAAILISSLNLFKNNPFFESAAVQIVITITTICLIVIGLTLLIREFRARQNM
ncbi:MAG: hypothetical protein K0R84_440 [Clostridia bacterium]|nr:hypothetical protein [Clostridia bacterium]